MENAVKALLMAAGVLMGVLILSLGASLYSSLSGYVQSVEENIASKEIQQFNQQFTRYINYNEDTHEKKFTLTIQDIVTAANIAYENNLKYGLADVDNNGNNYRVTITLDGNALENIINSESARILTNGLEQEYKCSSEDIEISTTTGRVFEVNFFTVP